MKDNLLGLTVDILKNDARMIWKPVFPDEPTILHRLRRVVHSRLRVIYYGLTSDRRHIWESWGCRGLPFYADCEDCLNCGAE